MRTTLLHPWKLSLFTGLSVTDFWLTWVLLRDAGVQAYEWNPVADWWLSRYDWAGLPGLAIPNKEALAG